MAANLSFNPLRNSKASIKIHEIGFGIGVANDCDS